MQIQSVGLSLIPAVALIACTLPANAQFKTELINWQGATAPCIGIGPVGGPLAKKCATMFEQAGFLRSTDLGQSGLTLAANATTVTLTVAPGSAAEAAGLATGDVLLAVNEVKLENHPGAEASRLLFGRKDQSVPIQFQHGSDKKEVTLTLATTHVKDPPKIGGFMLVVKPIVNWRGDYVPCVGAGPAFMAAIAFCEHHFSDFGFVKPDEAASAGLTFDQDNTQAAIVKTVAPDSPAARAGILVGDKILAVNGKPIPPNTDSQAQQLLFAKTGAKFQLSYSHQGQTKTTTLTLVAITHEP